MRAQASYSKFGENPSFSELSIHLLEPGTLLPDGRGGGRLTALQTGGSQLSPVGPGPVTHHTRLRPGGPASPGAPGRRSCCCCGLSGDSGWGPQALTLVGAGKGAGLPRLALLRGHRPAGQRGACLFRAHPPREPRTERTGGWRGLLPLCQVQGWSPCGPQTLRRTHSQPPSPGSPECPSRPQRFATAAGGHSL